MKTYFALLCAILVLAACSKSLDFNSLNKEDRLDNSTSSSSLKKNLKQPLKVFKAGGPVIVDGQDTEWIDVPPRKIRAVLDLGVPIENKKDLSSSAQMMWDENYLYFLVTVADQDINVSGFQPFEKDGIEIYLDGDNSKNEAAPGFPTVFPPPAYDENDDFIRFSPGETSVFGVWGNIDASQVEFAFNITVDGYQLEVAIPFADLPSFDGEEGHEFGLEFQINDNDGGQRQNSLKKFSALDESFYNPSTFGSAVLFGSVAE